MNSNGEIIAVVRQQASSHREPISQWKKTMLAAVDATPVRIAWAT
jgi:hypothetical protein